MNNICNKYDICIIGGGASGMIAAITAAKTGASVLVFETNSDLGHKILATGNGKCNFTNSDINAKAYHDYNYDFFESIYCQFDHKKTIEFFKQLGVWPDAKGDLYYPRNMEASSIRNSLVNELNRLNVDVIFERKIKDITYDEKDSIFIIDNNIKNREAVICKAIIIATGGNVSKIPGSNGDGFYYASKLGHNIIQPNPALSKIILKDNKLKSASGVRCKCKIDTFINNKLKESHNGELQITTEGISGIVVFQSSREIAKAINRKLDNYLVLDFIPEYSKIDLKNIIEDKINLGFDLSDVLKGLLPNKLSDVFLKELNYYNKNISNNEELSLFLENVISILKEYKVIPSSVDKDIAQVTTGGVDVTELDCNTLESKIMSGIYFAGEVVDVDGICGGYNLQWAWCSGYVAGLHAAKSIGFND